jgi:hypothetical protein
MKTSLRNMSLAVALLVSATSLMSLQADAKASFMAECSAKFKAAKAADTLGADTKWTDFMKHQCAADATAAAPAAPAAVPAKAVAPAAKAAAPAAVDTASSGSFMANCSAAWKSMKAAGTVPAGMAWKDFVAGKCVATPAAAMAPKVPAAVTAAAPATTPSGSFMANCSTAWKAMKAAGTVPEGMKWKDFVAGKCAATPAAATAPMVKPMKKKPAVVMQDETPAEPATAVDATPVKTMDKNGKPFTPGQMAAHARARACGAKWRGEKAAGTLQVGMKWPQYWSACNTEMKAAGQ